MITQEMLKPGERFIYKNHSLTYKSHTPTEIVFNLPQINLTQSVTRTPYSRTIIPVNHTRYMITIGTEFGFIKEQVVIHELDEGNRHKGIEFPINIPNLKHVQNGGRYKRRKSKRSTRKRR
jgi:hypothetical protein